MTGPYGCVVPKKYCFLINPNCNSEISNPTLIISDCNADCIFR